MLFIQIALTAVIVHVVAVNRLRIGIHDAVHAAMTNKPVVFPHATALLATGAYWTAVVSGLAGVWSVV
jgi:hypothetical protein